VCVCVCVCVCVWCVGVRCAHVCLRACVCVCVLWTSFSLSESDCNDAYGARVRVDSGVRWDQFQSFRDEKMEQQTPECAMWPEMSFLDVNSQHESRLRAAFRCQRAGPVWVGLALQASEYRLRKLFATPRILVGFLVHTVERIGFVWEGFWS
jgi:hypothetical protein